MRIVITILLLLATSTGGWAGQFFGTLALDPNPADPLGKTKVLRGDFGFEDAEGLRWMAGKGDVTDGASIPALFRPIVGGAFDERYIRAAVIHDHYCDPKHNVRSWRKTHRVFYDALLTAGVSKGDAKILYYAVYTFGPRWAKISAGTPCGPNCVFTPPGGGAGADEFYREEMYTPEKAAELQAVSAQIRALDEGPGISLDRIEALSDARHGDDVFLSALVTE